MMLFALHIFRNRESNSKIKLLICKIMNSLIYQKSLKQVQK